LPETRFIPFARAYFIRPVSGRTAKAQMPGIHPAIPIWPYAALCEQICPLTGIWAFALPVIKNRFKRVTQALRVLRTVTVTVKTGHPLNLRKRYSFFSAFLFALVPRHVFIWHFFV